VLWVRSPGTQLEDGEGDRTALSPSPETETIYPKANKHQRRRLTMPNVFDVTLKYEITRKVEVIGGDEMTRNDAIIEAIKADTKDDPNLQRSTRVERAMLRRDAYVKLIDVRPIQITESSDEEEGE